MSDKELVKIRSEIIDDLDKVSERWGLSGILGRIYGTLIFSNKPLGLDEIAKTSGYSKSSISQSMKLLENIGNTKRTKVPGSKKDPELHAPRRLHGHDPRRRSPQTRPKHARLRHHNPPQTNPPTNSRPASRTPISLRGVRAAVAGGLRVAEVSTRW